MKKQKTNGHYEYWYCNACQKRWRFFKASVQEIYKGEPRCPICKDKLVKTK